MPRRTYKSSWKFSHVRVRIKHEESAWRAEAFNTSPCRWEKIYFYTQHIDFRRAATFGEDGFHFIIFSSLYNLSVEKIAKH